MNYICADKHSTFAVQFCDIRPLSPSELEKHKYFVEPCVGRWYMLVAVHGEVTVYSLMGSETLAKCKVNENTTLYEIRHLPDCILGFLTEIMQGWR